MGSHKKSPKKKKQAPREYSLEVGTEPTFSNMERSSVRQGTQDSDESWLRYYLADNTPTPLPKKKQVIKPQPKGSEDIPLISPEKLKIKPSRQSSVANIKSKGTGPHDNKLAKAQGTYREPSLRRGSGMPFDTPNAFRKIPSTETSNTRHDETQSTESVAGHSTKNSQPSSGQKANGNDPYGIDRPKAQRGDLNPVGHHPLAIVKKTAPVQNNAPPRPANKKDDEKQDEATENLKSKKREDPVTRSSDYIPNEKESILKICFTLKDIYFSQPKYHEQEFWEAVACQLPIHSQYKDNWKNLKHMVDRWCRARRHELRDGTLDKSTNAGIELHALIDQWNSVYATRFCRENRGFLNFVDERPVEQPLDVPEPTAPRCKPGTSMTDFDEKIWPAVKEILIPFAESKIVELIENKLQGRIDELQSLVRAPTLKGNSSPETYYAYLNYLRGRIHATGKSSTLIRESEAVISLIADLLPSAEMNLRQQLVGDVEEHDGGSGMSEHEGHDESHEDIEDDEDAVSCYQPSILDSIEPRTPIVTPRVMAQLRKYENIYVEALRVAEAHQEVEDEALQSLDDNGHGRNAPADAIKGLAIRNKSTGLAAPNTPEGPARKKQCLKEHQLGSSPPSSPNSPFPSVEQLFSSSMGRESSAITQPTPVPPRSSFGATKKRKNPYDFGENGSPAPKATLHSQESPGLFVTPDPSLSGRSDRLFKFKKSVSRSVVLGKKRASENEKYAEVSRFREETAEYQALSPNERETMMYRAIKEMRKQ
ncbi:hypothetical protein KAF25_010859 [Fusarium avenaceum]|uniref:Uncharacterized protein n=1 Tax=Fusarium avenaceum TaxID=40199 RepID=A0A9P7KQC4_9HYPO|nr:hypothetical protein KAF25_010859 [Fusarium avenaceum]